MTPPQCRRPHLNPICSTQPTDYNKLDYDYDTFFLQYDNNYFGLQMTHRLLRPSNHRYTLDGDLINHPSYLICGSSLLLSYIRLPPIETTIMAFIMPLGAAITTAAAMVKKDGRRGSGIALRWLRTFVSPARSSTAI